MEIMKTVNLPHNANSTIEGSYSDGNYLYAWGKFGIGRIYIDKESFYPTKLDDMMDSVVASSVGSTKPFIIDIKEDAFNP